MPQNLRVKVGEKYGRLTVMERAPNRGIRTFWKCKCDCGAECEADGHELVRTDRPGKKSCGCLATEAAKTKNKTHGMSYTPEFRAWSRMKKTCEEPNSIEKGVSYPEEWAKFEGFFADLGAQPEGHVLGRKDIEKSYDKENCQWMTQKEAYKSRSSSVTYEYNGEKYSPAELSEKTGINISTLTKRIRDGMSVAEAVEAPVRGRSSNGVETMRNKKFSFNGEEHTITQWAAITGVPISTIYTRLAYGWDMDKVLIKG